MVWTNPPEQSQLTSQPLTLAVTYALPPANLPWNGWMVTDHGVGDEQSVIVRSLPASPTIEFVLPCGSLTWMSIEPLIGGASDGSQVTVPEMTAEPGFMMEP